MKYAVAILNIKPAEFWDLTLAEFNIAMEAYMWKQEQTRLINAEHALWTMLPHVKAEHMPSPAQLVGLEQEEKEEKQVTTKDDIEEMKARMGK